MSVEAFFAYARERHSVHLKRSSGVPGPWTDDPVLQTYRFCNVFRELDRTTVWFAKNVRELMRQQPEVLLSTVLFRLFNRISTGEAIFLQSELFSASSAWACFSASNWGRDGVDYLQQAVRNVCGEGPYVTGSYIIKTPDGYDKLDGVLKIVEWFTKTQSPVTADGGFYEEMDWREFAGFLLENQGCVSLEYAWEWLRGHRYIGDFTAYEIVTDLRHTALLDQAPDIMTWANPGPGAKRGLGWVYGETGPRAWQIEKMRELLALSREPQYWPNRQGGVVPGDILGLGMATEEHWPAWEMREVEHTLCEFDKYTRVQNGGPAPRQRFRGGAT